MDDEGQSRNWFLQALAVTGRGVATGGAWVGQRAVELYKAIDPDVQRHLVQIPLLAYTLFDRRDAQIEPGEPDGQAPLVFVHGHGGNRGNFLLMSWLFWLAGRKRSYRIQFRSGRGIEQQAQDLAGFVERVCQVNQEPQVDLVAHSLGGVVARIGLQESGMAERVRTFVSLGAPHAGTYPARYANTEILKNLRPGSELVRRINEKTIPAGVRVVCLFSHNDLFVLPAESAVLQGAEVVDLTPFTHYSYLLDPKGFEAVRRALVGAGPLTAE
jgi:triacylglycerol esterase/lipase EstA (alpha/beta hydrolase family)